MRGLDFSSWQAVLSTVLGLGIVTLVMVGIRLMVMQTIQQRRERENRQINERLRTLIAAYKTLGGSFTGNLSVDPAHLRDLRLAGEPNPPPAETASPIASQYLRFGSSPRGGQTLMLAGKVQVALLPSPPAASPPEDAQANAASSAEVLINAKHTYLDLELANAGSGAARLMISARRSLSLKTTSLRRMSVQSRR